MAEKEAKDLMMEKYAARRENFKITFALAGEHAKWLALWFRGLRRGRRFVVEVDIAGVPVVLWPAYVSASNHGSKICLQLSRSHRSDERYRVLGPGGVWRRHPLSL
jgi:hypothetical protein